MEQRIEELLIELDRVTKERDQFQNLLAQTIERLLRSEVGDED